MFSHVGEILRTPRIAEQTDTRQSLQHHDPEYQRRRKNKNNTPKDQDDTLEDAFVSVEALQVFLENFLKTKGNQRKDADTQQSYSGPERRQRLPNPDKAPQRPGVQAELKLGDDKRQKSAQAARAAYAYQSMSHANKKQKVLLETTDSAQGPEFDLQSDDVRTIHDILDKLKTLSQRNIEILKIRRAESFLQSLMIAVDNALSASSQNPS